MKQRIDEYFKKNSISPKGNWKLYVKTAIILISSVSIYYTLIFVRPESAWVNIGLSLLLGCCLALIGFNIMHDGAHGSYSNKSAINETMAYTLNLLGGNAYFWKQKHNVGHHTFTNIEGVDDDLDAKPFFRMNSGQKKYFIHKFQHVYWVFLYGMLYFLWITTKDMKKYFMQRVSPGLPKFPMTWKNHLMYWSSKVIHAYFFFVLPIQMVGVKALIGYVICMFFLGLILATVFQLAHVVDHTEFVIPTDKNACNIESEWAIHQVKTTSNFAIKNKFLTWALGGLNYQVEHHLFPLISHVHYPALNAIVKQTCVDYNLPILEHRTFLDALRSHVRLLRQLGK